MAERTELRTWSFVSLLIGGILIAVGGLVGSLTMGPGGWMGRMSMRGPMSGYVDDAWLNGMAWWMGGVGLVTGALVLIAAYHVHHRREAGGWSVVAIVAGTLSLFAMGGYLVGAIAAIVGGALAIADSQQQAPRVGGA